MQEETAPRALLDESALEALRRTRPWLYLLGVLSCIFAALGLIMLIAGGIGLGINSAKASLVIGGGTGLFLIALPSAITQLGYATALSRLQEARPGDLPQAVERACVRQHYLWVVNAFTVGLLAVSTLARLVAAALAL